jgi:RNA polymerase sigma factor (sigma-70 family)
MSKNKLIKKPEKERKKKKEEKRAKTLLNIYFEQLGDKVPLLSVEEEIALAKKIEAKDPEASRQLARANLGLVVSIAKDYVNGSDKTLFTLIQEGNYGLMLAVRGFDWRRETRFSTYATKCIKGAIEHAKFGKPGIFSLDAPINSDDDAESMYGVIEDRNAVSPSRGTEINFLRGIVREALSKLEPLAQEVMTGLFGLENGIMLKKKEVAQRLGISVERVRSIREKSLHQLEQFKELEKIK